MKLLKLFLFALLASALVVSCSDDETMDPNNPMNPDDMSGGNMITGEIWTGSNITFRKEEDSDPNDAANQDRITDNVWITRGNDGGQIFNIKKENASNKSNSPIDTEWALGKTDDVENLTFDNFRNTIRPKDVVGKDLVLHLITDDIYIDIKFSDWSESKSGGFEYSRSTQ